MRTKSIAEQATIACRIRDAQACNCLGTTIKGAAKGTFRKTFKILSPKGNRFPGFFKNDILPVSMCARLYRKNVIDHALQETSLYDKEITLMGEDQFFNVKLFPYLHSVYRIDKTVYIYRFGGGTTYFNPRFTQLFTLSDKRLKLLDQYNYNEGYGYLFDEYVACLFYHASRLIFCNVTDKDGVIDFFKKEINHRELMPRLVEYYTEKGIKNQQVQSLINRDYEGMYKCALDLVEQRKRSLKMRIRSYAITVLSQWS